MKNQYFGDKRDYFKYSLLETLAVGIPGIEQLTCIWMLTAPVVNNHGQKRFVPSSETSRLTGFLEDCRSRGVKDIREMVHYFRGHGYAYFSYMDDPAEYFCQSNRARYFEEIPQKALRKAVVFFDPDNGLEPEHSNTSAHLGFDELASVFARMDAASVAVIYQHLPRIAGAVFWPWIAAKLHERLRAPAAFVAQGDLAFYLVPGNNSTFADVRGLLETRYNSSVPGIQRITGHVP